jgi:hypothetical protein
MTTGNHPPAAPPPDAPDPDGDERLPCGRLLSQVWGDWEDGTEDDHRRTCPHCRRATADLEQLESTVRQLRDVTAVGPELIGIDTGALARRVMDVVRLELRPGRPLPLGRPEEDLRIMESVAARTLRAAAERVAGVRAGSCRIAPTAEFGQVTVALDIHAPVSTVDLKGLAEQVRHSVRRAADGRIGLDVAGIDIRITDLVEAPGPDEEGPGR